MCIKLDEKLRYKYSNHWFRPLARPSRVRTHGYLGLNCPGWWSSLVLLLLCAMKWYASSRRHGAVDVRGHPQADGLVWHTYERRYILHALRTWFILIDRSAPIHEYDARTCFHRSIALCWDRSKYIWVWLVRWLSCSLAKSYTWSVQARFVQTLMPVFGWMH